MSHPCQSATSRLPTELTDDAGTFTLDDDGITTLGDFRVTRW